jgi:multidrug efflux pump subunit AcrA (membrane-fusion protein)
MTRRLSFPRRRRPQGAALIASLVLACAALLLNGCTFGQAPEPTPIPLLVTPQAAGAPALGRTIYTVQRGDVRNEVTFAAEVALDTREELYFGTSGRVQTIYVHSGDMVKLDQIIAMLDTRVLELDRAAATTTLELARQRLALAEARLRFDTLQLQLDLQTEKLKLKEIEADPQASELDRTLQELAVRGAELALQQLESGVEPGLQADVTRAEIALRKVQVALADGEITAPFEGQILLYDALEQGKVVQAYTPVAAIVDPRAVVLEANLLPAELEVLHEGMSVTIAATTAGTSAELIPESSAMPAGVPADGPSAPLLVGVIRTLPQPFGTGAGPTTVIVPQDTDQATWYGSSGLGPLRPGATVVVSASRAMAKDVLWLPPAAVQGYKDNYFVRLRDGSERAITVGIFAADRVEVAGGLAFGEEVLGK